MIDFLMILILAGAPVALFGALCALNAMDGYTTRKAISGAFLLVAWGWAALIFAAGDYLLHRDPHFWPVALLGGVACLALGNALMFVANRRRCDCVGCPGRRRVSP